MPFYTPNDLANSSYVASMTPSDRDSALAWSKEAAALQQSKLDEKNAALATATQVLAQAPTRQQVVAAREKAQDPTLSQAERDAASVQAVALENQRASALTAKGEAEVAAANQAKIVTETNDGITNLQQAGATPNPSVQPAVNSAEQPVQAATAAQVPDASNPNAKPETTAPVLENAVPAATPFSSDPAQRVQAAAAGTAPVTPSDIAENPMGQDPAQRAQVADQIAIDNAQTISTLQDPQQAAQAKLNAAPDIPAANSASQDPAQRAQGIGAEKQNTQSQATQQNASNFKQLGDWRVRLSLAPGATYLYKDPNVRTNQSILLPLAQTDGVIFPYTPAISVSYVADYAPTNLTHSNYTFNSYTSSKVDNITIACDFTAQDTSEATYLLAVIHFFRSATKMFYGQDKNPKNGTPPPLCYLTGLGAFQFDEHPLAITAFNYTLPTDVDYIRAGNPTTSPGANKSPETTKSNAPSTSGDRMNNNNLSPGGRPGAPVFSINYSTREPTYVPTKISLSITAVPIVTRGDISNNFSLAKYATGELLRGSKRTGGGIW